MAIDVSKLRPVAEFTSATDEFARALRAVRPAEGFDAVIVPGELEAKKEAQRHKEGIPVRDDDWQYVMNIAKRLDVR